MSRLADPKSLKDHPERGLLPDLPPDDYERLKAELADEGILIPLIVTDEDVILDGHHRRRAAVELGLDTVPITRLPGLSKDEEIERLLKLNTHRRHLSRAERRDLVRTLLERWPERSDRWLASLAGVHHETVGSVRTELEGTGEIRQLDERVGQDKKVRSVPKPKPKPPEGRGRQKSKVDQLREMREARYETTTEPTRPAPKRDRYQTLTGWLRALPEPPVMDEDDVAAVAGDPTFQKALIERLEAVLTFGGLVAGCYEATNDGAGS